MFTGLVETIGTVTNLTSLDSTASGGSGTSLTISDCGPILDSTSQLGDSISINGTCLTVTSFDLDAVSEKNASPSFKVGISPETLRRTNLGSLTEGSRVNLERAVSAATRMGGHFVQGHVDTVATIARITPDGNALTFRFRLESSSSRHLLRYIVEKGYITLDGASLTVTAVDDSDAAFEVMLIAYTQERIVTSSKKVGDGVNVEIDVVGKYVEKSVGAYFGQMVTKQSQEHNAAKSNGSRSDENQNVTPISANTSADTSTPAILVAMVNRIVDERLKKVGMSPNSR